MFENGKKKKKTFLFILAGSRKLMIFWELWVKEEEEGERAFGKLERETCTKNEADIGCRDPSAGNGNGGSRIVRLCVWRGNLPLQSNNTNNTTLITDFTNTPPSHQTLQPNNKSCWLWPSIMCNPLATYVPTRPSSSPTFFSWFCPPPSFVSFYYDYYSIFLFGGHSKIQSSVPKQNYCWGYDKENKLKIMGDEITWRACHIV